MTKFHYIRFDDGVTYYDRYFEYLSNIKKTIPSKFSEFFCDENSIDSKVELILFLASHIKRIKMTYIGVSGFLYINQPSFWEDKAVDLLTHEFTVQKGKFRHLMQFDRDVWLSIVFKDFEYKRY